MLPFIRLGPFLLPTTALALLAGFWLGFSLVEREANRLQLTAAHVTNGALVAVVAGLVGARLVYVARYLDVYLASPLSILSRNLGALAPTEGIVIGVLAAGLYCRRKKLSLRLTLDVLTPLLAALAVGLGLAHLANGSAYGAPTKLPWAIYLWDDYRHPAQVYEILAAALILGLIWCGRKASLFPGFLFLSWLTLSAGARLLLETFRGDSVLVLGGLRTAQLGALAVLLFSLWLMGRWARTDAGQSQMAPSQTQSGGNPEASRPPTGLLGGSGDQ